MFTALGRLAARRAKLLLFGSLVAFAATVILGGGVFGSLSSGGFDDPGSDSARATEFLEHEFDAGTPNILLVVTAKTGDIDAAPATTAGRALTADLKNVEGIDQVQSYWETGSPPSLRSGDGDSALVFANAPGDEDVANATVQRVQDKLAGDKGAVTVAVGGEAAIEEALGTSLEDGLALAEMIAIPLTLLLLLLVFRGVVAAVLPLVVGGAATFGAFFVLWLIAQVTDVSVFSIN
ncbi:MAG: MMPL family transporter, partial [Spirillospora sp.]